MPFASRKSVLLVAAVALFSGLGSGVFAQGRPDSLRMTCEAARRLVSERGAVILGSGPDIFDRFVATQAFCQRDEYTEPVWVPTGDTKQCFVGYRCKRHSEEVER
jgi:hypothetical protein